MHIPLLPHHPIVRPIATFLFLALIVYSLLAHWQQHGGGHPMFDEAIENNAFVHEMAKPTADTGSPKVGAVDSPDVPVTAVGEPRMVVAHFMLGNTYTFSSLNWEETFDMAEDTGLDGLVLNLGNEDWQYRQARAAYLIAEERMKNPVIGRNPIKLTLSLDCNVLKHDTMEDAQELVPKIAKLLNSPPQLKYDGKPLLTAFSGQNAKWGGGGWKAFLQELKWKMPTQVSFWPAFFQPPSRTVNTPWIDGAFTWNGAWPMTDNHISLSNEELTYIASDKPFMAAVSPLFFTHYGKEGDWAFDKNWIYRSDDLLYPSRWSQILALSDKRAPEIVQVISWNDFGESHNIAPVLGVEPGSQQWTKGMDHVAFREMTKYFTGRWRDGLPEVPDNEIVVWIWYRIMPKDVKIDKDPVGEPKHTDRAQDLINALVLVPDGLSHVEIEVTTGRGRDESKIPRGLSAGRSNAVTFPFKPGPVHFEVRSAHGVHMRYATHQIYSSGLFYNFNMWSGAYRVKVDNLAG